MTQFTDALSHYYTMTYEPRVFYQALYIILPYLRISKSNNSKEILLNEKFDTNCFYSHNVVVDFANASRVLFDNTCIIRA